MQPGCTNTDLIVTSNCPAAASIITGEQTARYPPFPKRFSPRIFYGTSTTPYWSVILVPNRPSIRSKDLVPCFRYTSDPAIMNASQIRATLCPSRFAIASIDFFRSELTLKVRRASFFIRAILASQRLATRKNHVDISDTACHPFVIPLSSLWMTFEEGSDSNAFEREFVT